MMETITKITAFVLALLSLMACSTDEPEPDPDGPDGPVPVVPYDFSAPIFPMEGFELGFEMWPTPTIDDSNLQGEYYIYLYWREHKGEAGNLEELLAMCNVPDDLLKTCQRPIWQGRVSIIPTTPYGWPPTMFIMAYSMS